MIIGISGKKGSGKDLSGAIIQGLTDKPTTYDGMDVITEEDVLYKVWDAPTFINIKFADTLKNFICMLLGCTREKLEEREYKETPLPKSWWYYKIAGKIYERGYYPDEADNRMCEKRYLVKTTPRLLLQLMGTECGRQILHPNLWVNAVMANYKSENYAPKDTPEGELYMWNKKPDWIITDMRFDNELKAVQEHGITIRINREHCCGDVGFCDHGDGFNCAKPIDMHPSETSLDEAEFDYTIENNGTIKRLVEKIKEILIKEKII